MTDPFEKVRTFVDRHSMFAGARGVVAAVSGGPDSVAMLDILVRLLARDAKQKEDEAGRREPVGRKTSLLPSPSRVTHAPAISIHVAHLDHMLRGRESTEDARFVLGLAEHIGLPASVESADVRAASKVAKKGIEETARELRYEFLLKTATRVGADRIAVGHTMDDQAETLLMRLARGAGTSGLAAMRPVAPTHIFGGRASPGDRPLLVRPLLCLTRREVELYCRVRGLSYRVDESNKSEDYTRNRIRHRVMLALCEINPRIAEALAQAAEANAADQDALGEIAASALELARAESGDADVSAYSVSAILQQPVGVRRRMLKEAIRLDQRAAAQVDLAHVSAVERLLADKMSGKRIELPGGVVVWREFDVIAFRPRAFNDAAYEGEISSEQPRADVGGFAFKLARRLPAASLNSFLEQAGREKVKGRRDWMFAVLDDGVLPDRLVIRPRRPGERARVLGQRDAKKLKNLMIDNKIPRSRRPAWPVVVTPDGEYVWSPGLPPAAQFAAFNGSLGLAILRASDV